MILCGFALVIGSLTVHRIRSDFNREVAETAAALPGELKITWEPFRIPTPLDELTADRAIVKILGNEGNVLDEQPAHAPRARHAQPRAGRGGQRLPRRSAAR